MNFAESFELKMLVVAVIVGLVQLVWATTAGAGGARDIKWLMGPRDDPRPVTGVAARVQRAFGNFMETFPLFAATVVAAVVAGKSGVLTYWGSLLYVAARALYVPLYATGVPAARTLVWTVSMIGIFLIIVAFFQ
jgi:uncharacterized MAPEG superfamily protein